jgi:rod shape determining protein RodA
MPDHSDIDALKPVELTLAQKVGQLNWGLIALVTMIAAIGFAMLYSAANGNWDPWAYRQMIRYGAGLSSSRGGR